MLSDYSDSKTAPKPTYT